MKKYLLLSDIHHNSADLVHLIRLYKGSVNGVFFAGDGLHHISILKEHFPVFAVRGNTDRELKFPLEQEINLDNIRIFLTHGHFFKVKSGLHGLKKNLKQKNYHLIIYGHTHIQKSTHFGYTQAVNPGAFSSGQYAMLYVEGNDFYLDFETLS